MFNFHGGDGTNTQWQTAANMRSIADTADFILVYPQARRDPSDGNSLNWLPKTPGTFDDVSFVSALIDTLAADYLIDQEKIYACGYSLGGEFSYELACKLSNRIAAIGAVARTMQANPNSYCSPTHPTGVLTILGTNDLISPYNGLTWAGVEYYISAATTHAYWANHNNCDATATKTTVSPSVERYSWSTASGCTYVEELKIEGGGHDWPGSFGNMTINSNVEIWQFVSRYDINGRIGCQTASVTEPRGENTKYTVYPNPAVSQLTIKRITPENQGYTMYNTLGSVVLTGILDMHTSTIDMSSLLPDVYILNIDNQSVRILKTE